jgi:hypothetical protein
LLIQNLVEKGGDLGAVHRLVEIGRHPRKIDALAQIVVAALLETLQENRHAFFRGRLPVVVDKAPQIVGQCIFLAEIDVDHRQHWPLAFVNAGQEERYDSVLDIVGIEIGGNGRAKTFDGGQEVWYLARRFRRPGAARLHVVRFLLDEVARRLGPAGPDGRGQRYHHWPSVLLVEQPLPAGFLSLVQSASWK